MIECRLCGGKFERITWAHLKKVHGIEFVEYERQFPDAPTYSEEMKRRTSNAVSETMKLKWKDPEFAKGVSESLRGQARSEVQKRNISEGTSRSMTEERKQRTSDALMGHVHSEETLKKISDSCNEAVTDEKRRRLSEALEGNQNALGHTLSEENRQLIAKAASEANLGREMSEEAKNLIAEKARERWSDPVFKQKALELWAASMHMRPTQPELYVQATLDEPFPGEWEYTGDGRVWLDGRNPDFMNVNGKKQVIEVFGMFWHEESEEAERIAHYKKLGFDCLVVWEYDTLNEDQVVDAIKSLGI